MTDHTDHPRFDIDSPRDWCSSDRRASNGEPFAPDYATFDGMRLDEWRSPLMPPESLTVDTRDTDRAPAESRWPTLEEIGLAEALDQLEAVAAMNQGKHPKLKWLGYKIDWHDAKSTWHLVRSQLGEPNDDDTGLPHRAHAALRLLMSLGLELKQKI